MCLDGFKDFDGPGCYECGWDEWAHSDNRPEWINAVVLTRAAWERS